LFSIRNISRDAPGIGPLASSLEKKHTHIQ
jgi:hypothetical protein